MYRENDYEIILMELLDREPTFILTIKEEFLNDELWKYSISKNPSLFQYISKPSIDVVLFSLEEDGANIQYLEEKGIDISIQMIHIAIKNYPRAVLLLPKQYRSMKIKEFACSLDPSLIKELNISHGYIEDRLDADPMLIRFIPNPSESQLLRAIARDPNACAYVKYFTPQIISLIEELYPDIIPMIDRLKKYNGGDRRYDRT